MQEDVIIVKRQEEKRALALNRVLAGEWTMGEAAEAVGLSVRQLRRDIDGFVDAFQFGLGGWRHEMRRLRLKIAALGLSAEGATVAEVARATGYGSTEAMARAFREAGLPPPSTVLSAFAE